MSGFGDYLLVRDLGEGNHGTFHLAEPPARLGIDVPVVVKRLDGHATDDDMRRLANELRLLHTLRSPHLVELLDAGRVGGRLYVTTRWYPAGPVDTASLALPERLAVCAGAARGAHELHEAGVTHRDIHPGNVLADDGRGRLGDLGLAHSSHSATATIGAGPVGTLGYLDPRLVNGEVAARSTDIWSLGLTIHAACGGREPYPGLAAGGLMGAFRRIVTAAPQLDARLDGDLLAIVRRCIAPIGERYGTAAELADDLEHLAGDLQSEAASTERSET